MQYSKGQPRNQNRRGWDPKYWWTLEGSFARTGGNFSAAFTLRNGLRTLQNLNFTFYRLDFTPKFVLGSKKLRFYVGPAVSRIIYAGVRIDQESSVRSATSGFTGFPAGYEAGFGMAFNSLQVSVRTLRYLTGYGNSYRGIGLPIKNNDIRIVLAFTLKERHKGSYWDSIDWDK